MSPRKTLFKRLCLPSMLRVSIPRLEKAWNYESPLGTPGHAKHFSCTWDLLWMQSRKEEDIGNLVKQAKAALAELDGTTSDGAGTSEKSSKKSSKKHKEVAATADAPKSDLQAMYQLDLEKAIEATEKPRPRWNQLLRICSSSMQTCCL
jgi:hypothetical protein